MVDALDTNFRGLIHVLAGVLVREVEREVAKPSTKTRKDSEEGDQTREKAECCSANPSEMKTRPGEARSRSHKSPTGTMGAEHDTAKEFTTRSRCEVQRVHLRSM